MRGQFRGESNGIEDTGRAECLFAQWRWDQRHTWVIRYLDQYPGAVVEVFNRYGQPVYHAIGYTTPWDGTYKGQPLPVGTYYWIIDPQERKEDGSAVR